MAETSTPYEADGGAAATWINGHGNALGAQGHQGRLIVRRHDAPVRGGEPVGTRSANAGPGGAGPPRRRVQARGVQARGVQARGVQARRVPMRGYGRDGGGWAVVCVMGEAQTMREKGEVWGLRVI
jgi:hypothetical protein